MNILRNIFLSISLLAFVACGEDNDILWDDSWGDTTVTPAPDQGEEPAPDKKEEKARVVWIDAAANFKDYANSEKNIADDMARIKNTGFTGVIVDVRPTNAGLLFKSDVESELVKVDAWLSSGYDWVYRTAKFDYLQAFIDAGKEVGLDVYASINTMVAGYNCPYGLGPTGPIYEGGIDKDWATIVNTEEGLKSTMDLGTGAKFLNPADDKVVNYLLGILEDLASYDLKGIILDRCRYDDNELMSDFSEVSREKFEEFIGEKVANELRKQIKFVDLKA